MSCTHCAHQFCWMCTGDWTGGSHYSCQDRRSKKSQDRLGGLVDKYSSSLSFHQLFLVHDGSRIHDDTRIKKIAEDRIKSYLKTQNPKVSDCEILLQAVEHIFLCRHIIINVIIMGEYREKHQQGGGKKLKIEIERLQSNIDLLCSFIDVLSKQIDFEAISNFTTAIRSGIKGTESKLYSIMNVKKKNFR